MVWQQNGGSKYPQKGIGIGHKENQNMPCQVLSKQGETSTILTFVNASGDAAPLKVIHKACQDKKSWSIKAHGDICLAAMTKGCKNQI